MKTPEQSVDSIAKWNNLGMRQAVIDMIKERDKEHIDYNEERDSLIKKLSDRCAILESMRTIFSKLLEVTSLDNLDKSQLRKFWVEIQHAEPFDEKDNPNELIYIGRRREDLDNVGEVFQVTEF